MKSFQLFTVCTKNILLIEGGLGKRWKADVIVFTSHR